MNKIFRSLLSLVVAMSILIIMPPVFSMHANAVDIEIETSSKGLFVHTYQNRDFPSKNGLSSKQIKTEISEMVSFAKQCGYTTIYFEAVPSADAMYQSKVYPTSGFWLNNQGDFSVFDPMSLLMEETRKADISVYAVINPFRVGTSTSNLDKKNLAVKNPNLAIPVGDNIYLNPSSTDVLNTVSSAAAEIVKKYNVAGIALEGLDCELVIDDDSYIESVNNFVSKISTTVNNANPTTKFGVILNADSRELYPSIRKWSENSDIDFLVPMINYPTTSNSLTYKSVLDTIKSLTTNSGAKLYTGNLASRVSGVSSNGEGFTDPNEINYQLFINYQNNIDGFVIDSYKTMRRNLGSISENILTMFSTSATLYSDTALTIPNTFAVTRPTNAITTTYDTYFITGTSLPGIPVYIDNTMVTSEPSKGTFGTLVSLKEGENTFTVTHNGKSIPIKITKRVKSDTTAPKISTISQASAQPQTSTAVKVLGAVELSCIAPYGGTVSATVNGLSVKLAPVATAENGTPTKFTGTINLSDKHPVDKTTNLGKVTYTLTYNGKITTAKSAGNVYAVGSNAKLSVSVSDYIAGVYADPAKEGDFSTTLKNGSTDYAIDQTVTHYKLKSGGYIKKTAVDINENAPNIDNTVSSVSHTASNENEAFIISGTAKVLFNSRIDKDAVVITLFNTYNLPDTISVEGSNLFSEVSTVKINDNTYSLRFVFKDKEKFWGYNVEYSDNDTIIYFKLKPELSNTYGKPLENVAILLDPGHGGKDPGAIGAAGVDAPMEAQINLAVAKATKHRLEQLGATVQMTRYDNTFVALGDRLRISEQMKPDFFISMHHNSLAESSDSNKAFGIEVYYHEDGSKEFASLLERDLSRYNKRVNRGYFQDYYFVTRMTYAPSVLAELGFLPNPLEYADITNQLSMYKTSCAISTAIIECLS